MNNNSQQINDIVGSFDKLLISCKSGDAHSSDKKRIAKKHIKNNHLIDDVKSADDKSSDKKRIAKKHIKNNHLIDDIKSGDDKSSDKKRIAKKHIKNNHLIDDIKSGDDKSSDKKRIANKDNIRGNKGEKGEICVVKKIYNLSKNNDIIALKSIFGDDAEDGILIYDMNTGDQMNDQMIKKAPSRNKADIKIVFKKNNICIYCSIKCEHGAMPTILNHTPRSAKIFQNGGDLFSELPNLDKLILMLNNERHKGNTGEDIHIKKMNIDEKCKESLLNTICYFLFTGTGSGKSKYPANSMIEIYDPSDIKKWKYYNCINNDDRIKYVKNIYDRIIISMRNKGMPSKKNVLCDPWIFIQKEENNITKEKGSLHIRLRK